ncbi:hypothetical protein G6F55_014327 [Rhizopus delemar]|nr:hypothetical protein G6F55_014327 [Rhizopus delemar]
MVTGTSDVNSSGASILFSRRVYDRRAFQPLANPWSICAKYSCESVSQRDHLAPMACPFGQSIGLPLASRAGKPPQLMPLGRVRCTEPPTLMVVASATSASMMP